MVNDDSKEKVGGIFFGGANLIDRGAGIRAFSGSECANLNSDLTTMFCWNRYLQKSTNSLDKIYFLMQVTVDSV